MSHLDEMFTYSWRVSGCPLAELVDPTGHITSKAERHKEKERKESRKKIRTNNICFSKTASLPDSRAGLECLSLGSSYHIHDIDVYTSHLPLRYDSGEPVAHGKSDFGACILISVAFLGRL